METLTQSNLLYVAPLRDLTRHDVDRVGAKAANLGELARAGFPVPDGFALTTQAFDQFVHVNGLDATHSPVPLSGSTAARSASATASGSGAAAT